jgi:hypothetical protein
MKKLIEMIRAECELKRSEALYIFTPTHNGNIVLTAQNNLLNIYEKYKDSNNIFNLTVQKENVYG